MSYQTCMQKIAKTITKSNMLARRNLYQQEVRSSGEVLTQRKNHTYLSNLSISLVLALEKRLFTVKITIRYADEQIIKTFIWAIARLKRQKKVLQDHLYNNEQERCANSNSFRASCSQSMSNQVIQISISHGS